MTCETLQDGACRVISYALPTNKQTNKQSYEKKKKEYALVVSMKPSATLTPPLLPNLSRLSLKRDNRNTQPSDIRGNYVKYTEEELRVLKAKDEEIKEAERLQYGVDTRFKLLFLGGSSDVDPARKRMFRNCRVLTAGNHYGADILGNWEENGFWDVIRQENPTCIVLDYGSDSWLNSLSKTLLMSTVNDLGCIFMFSPWRDIDVMDDGGLEPEPNMMYTETPLRYNATVFSNQEVLFTFWNKLEERDTYPSEILNQINTEWATVDMDVEERKLNYNARNAFSNWDNRNSKSQSFIDAVKSQISMFTSCADVSSSFGWGATALQRVQPISRTDDYSSSRPIVVYPIALLTGEMDVLNAFFVQKNGWTDGRRWRVQYYNFMDEHGVIQFDTGSSGAPGDKATIRLFYKNDRTEIDVQTYEITLGDTASVLSAFLKYASYFGRLGAKLFASEESPWYAESGGKVDQFAEVKAIIEQTKREIEVGMTDSKRQGIRSLQGFVFKCTRDVAEMKLDGKIFSEDFECGSFGLQYYEQKIEAVKSTMVTAPFDFYVISAAEDAYSDDQLASPFVLKRFLATTVNFKMMQGLQRWGSRHDHGHPFTLLAIKVKAGARFLPFFAIESLSSTQEYEVVIDTNQLMTPLKLEVESSTCELFGGGDAGCRVAWLEVSAM